MDFNTLANGIYANNTAAVLLDKDGTMKTAGRGEFLREAGQAWNEAVEKRVEDKLYADGAAKDEEEPSIIEQLADPGSAFYQDMLLRMKIQMEMSDEQKKEQAIIDALDAILEGMRPSDKVDKQLDVATSMAGLSKQISELDKDDPRRAQLDLFRQRLNQMGIYMDLGESIFGGKKDGNLALTQQLIREKTGDFDPSAFDLF